jgi:hypothetical protein
MLRSECFERLQWNGFFGIKGAVEYMNEILLIQLTIPSGMKDMRCQKHLHSVIDLVMDDRECNWDLHLQSIQAVLPLFGDGDRISYLRWGSLSGG